MIHDPTEYVRVTDPRVCQLLPLGPRSVRRFALREGCAVKTDKLVLIDLARLAERLAARGGAAGTRTSAAEGLTMP